MLGGHKIVQCSFDFAAEAHLRFSYFAQDDIPGM
jgi:hypothetical protein